MIMKYRWTIVLMLASAGLINYLDRSAFGVALPFITKEININAAQTGIILSSFFMGYALFNFVGGYLSDVYGPKKVLGGSMTAWSVFCGLTAAAFNFPLLFIVRLLFGFGEGPIASTVNKTISNWLPVHERARAVGFASAGNPIGGAIAGPIVGFIALAWGWRASFIILTVIGLGWTLAWLKLSSDYPCQNPRVSPEELREIEQNQRNESSVVTAEKVSFAYFIKQPTVLFTALAFFGLNYMLYFFLSWFPSYLVMVKHLSIQQMSIATMIPWLIGSVGMGLSGLVSDYIYQKTGKLMFSRKIVIVFGLSFSAVCIAFAGLVETAVSAVALMAAAIFFLYITAALYWAIISDNVPSARVGGVGGFVHLLANISGIIAPSVTGFIVQSTGKFTSAFILAGALAIIGSLGVAFFVKPIVKSGEINTAA